MRFELVERLRRQHPVRVLCRVLEVSASGFYAWRDRGESARDRGDRRLAQEILAAHAEGKGCYGTPRILAALLRAGRRTSRRRVARLRRQLALRAKARRRYRVTTDSAHAHPVAENLLDRQFHPPGPNLVWAADITYLATAEGWLYLAVVLDLFSRRVVGWACSTRCDSDLAATALRRALALRRPQPGLLHHSDRGTQYCAGSYQRLLTQHGLIASMSRKGNCWDNSVVESFFKTLKTEMLADADVSTRQGLHEQLFTFIEGFYNRRRLHSTLGFLTPVEAERRRREETA